MKDRLNAERQWPLDRMVKLTELHESTSKNNREKWKSTVVNVEIHEEAESTSKWDLKRKANSFILGEYNDGSSRDNASQVVS